MNQRNTNGIVGLFVGFVIMAGLFILFINVVSFLLPLIIIIVIALIFWSFIKGLLRVNRTKSATSEDTTQRKRQQHTKKDKSKKEPIDVEYTVIDDEPIDKEKKNDR